MADQIIDGDTYNWNNQGGKKGQTRYQHLLDGNARKLKIADYGHSSTKNFLTVLRAAARDRGMTFRSSTVDDETVVFQVTGKP